MLTKSDRLPKFAASIYFTSVKSLNNATEGFYKKLNSFAYTYFTSLRVPVGIKEVVDHFGTCFNLVTYELATLDTRFQGKVSLVVVH